MISINTLTPKDFALIEPLADEFKAAHDGLPFKPDFRKTFKNWIQLMSSEESAVVYLARYETEVAGLAVGKIDKNGPLLMPERIGYVSMLVVSPKFRQKDVGKNLWDGLKDWFSSNGIKEIHLYTKINNDTARNFWESCGFKTILERRKTIIK